MAKEKRVETQREEMTMEEARKYRASLYKPEINTLTDSEKREAFRLFWAQNKYQYGKGKEIEQILWLHLTSAGLNDPSQFVEGLNHFGLKKI